MRILFVNPVGQIGGAERVLLDCIAAIRQIEPEHELHALLMDDGPLADAARAAGANVTVLRLPESLGSIGDSATEGKAAAKASILWRGLLATPAMWAYVRQFRRAIATLAPDVVHSNGLKSHLMLGLARVPQPIVWHVHDFVGARPMIAGLLRRLSGGVTPVAISNAVAEDIRRWLPGSTPRLVMNGIDTERFTPGPSDGAMLDALAQSSSPPPDTLAQSPAAAPDALYLDGLGKVGSGSPHLIRIGLLATYARWKGQDVFIRAAAQLIRDRPDAPVRFYVIGGPIYTTRGSQFSREELVAIARDAGVFEQVACVPLQPDPVPIYRALDIVVHASTRPEPFGLTIVEAMSCGRAVVVSAAGGACELFDEGADAIGVEPANANTLAWAMRRLLDDPTLRAALGERARQSVVRRFGRHRMGDVPT